jgi:hypothetical protein
MDDFPANSGFSPIPDLRDEAVRQRLGPPALKAFSQMMVRWRVPDEKAKHLLALAAETNIDYLDPSMLGQEQLLRISYLVGIYKALHTLFSDKLADQWIRLSNTNAMFGGCRDPLTFMVDGGIEAIRTVRNLLDARCAGN